MTAGHRQDRPLETGAPLRFCARIACAAVASWALVGCTYVSSDGPSRGGVRDGATAVLADAGPPTGFVVLDLTANTLQASNAYTRNITPRFAHVASGPSSRQGWIGVGDVVNITIFEAAAGGLFIPAEGNVRGANFVPIPPQQVESNGKITVPYAGTIQAAGRTPQDVSREIASRLKQRAVEPQVVVSVAEKRSASINVLGDVYQPQRLTLDPGGMRVLEAIARSGGPRSGPHETIVTIRRGDRTTQALLSAVVKAPEQNPFLSPGDTVFLSKEPRYYLTLGATPAPGAVGGLNNRRFTFENDNMNLIEAAAKSGGLDAGRADPRAVFIYRLEPRQVLEQLGVDVSGYSAGLIPTIYSADFSRSDTFFLAGDFAMRNQDVIFIAEAPSVGLTRFTAALSGLSGNAAAIASARAY